MWNVIYHEISNLSEILSLTKLCVSKYFAKIGAFWCNNKVIKIKHW